MKTGKVIKKPEQFILEKDTETVEQNISFDHSKSIKSLYNNDQRINHLIPQFLERLKTQLFDLEKHINEKDLKLTQKMMHKMKGGCGSYGFPELYETLSKLESIVADHDFSNRELAAEFSLFKKLIERVEV